jgi:hypothetical protein
MFLTLLRSLRGAVQRFHPPKQQRRSSTTMNTTSGNRSRPGRLFRSFTTSTAAVLVLLGSLVAAYGFNFFAEYESGIKWAEPKVVDPGPAGGPPSDAIVLFNGKDLSQWDDSKWIVEDGCAIAHGADMKTKRAFGDCQLHLEWATPEKVEGDGQGRGNSGVFLMGIYEVQILDSYQNPTYYDGQAAAIYKQHPPLVNVCQKPGEWQTYDIIFAAPKFDKDGKVEKPAYITALQNGVLVQNHFKIQGQTSWDLAPAYHAHPEKMPLSLQYHGNPVKFRNIWIRDSDNSVKEPNKQIQ